MALHSLPLFREGYAPSKRESGAILLPVQFRVHVQSSLSTSAASSSMLCMVVV